MTQKQKPTNVKFTVDIVHCVSAGLDCAMITECESDWRYLEMEHKLGRFLLAVCRNGPLRVAEIPAIRIVGELVLERHILGVLVLPLCSRDDLSLELATVNKVLVGNFTKEIDPVQSRICKLAKTGLM